MAGSVHDKLSRVRKPRVHITYDVETEGATQQKELPFVVGVMGDFSGDPTSPLKPLKERKFVSIDRDNFDSVLASMTPGLNLKVDNTIADDGTELAVNLKFESMDDFQPINIVKQVDPLAKLYETREKLKELQTKADRSEDLQEVLESVLQETASLTKVAEELGIGESDSAPAAAAPAAAPEPAPAPAPEPAAAAPPPAPEPAPAAPAAEEPAPAEDSSGDSDEGESLDDMLRDMGIDT